MVMMDKADRMFQPRKPQYEPEKPSPSGCPFDAMFATNHLIASQYSPTCTKIMSALRYWIPVRARQMDRKIAPKYHHRMVTGRPLEPRAAPRCRRAGLEYPRLFASPPCPQSRPASPR